jgi:four helix bundle protein
MNGYTDLIVWQKAFLLAEKIYLITEDFPAEERYGLTSQMRRAAVSIPSNIAEGYRRRHHQEWRQFVHIAFGSAAELETQLLLAKKLKLAPEDEFVATENLLSETLRLLNRLCNSLR